MHDRALGCENKKGREAQREVASCVLGPGSWVQFKLLNKIHYTTPFWLQEAQVIRLLPSLILTTQRGAPPQIRGWKHGVNIITDT